MFGLLKRTQYYDKAQILYGMLLKVSRRPEFYDQGKVPDTFDGRFDLLIVHCFLVIQRLGADDAAGKQFNQDLFDVFFADMDQTLREIGIGDVGVPKHMKKMMKAFNGRVHAYQESLDKYGTFSDDVLVRNLYGTTDKPDEKVLKRMQDYLTNTMNVIAEIPVTDFYHSNVTDAMFPKF